MGTNMRHALNFAKRHPGWHSYLASSRQTRDAIIALAQRGLVEHSETTQQFRITDRGMRYKE